MPDLVGSNLEEAQTELGSVNPLFNLTYVYEPSSKPNNTVLEQSLPPGTPLPAGEPFKVKLTVSGAAPGPVTDLCKRDKNLPEGLDCDPATGTFVLEGTKCRDRGATGTLDHLVCMESTFCKFDQWAKKGEGPSTAPCKFTEYSGEQRVLTPGEDCVLGEPLPYPYVCRNVP